MLLLICGALQTVFLVPYRVQMISSDLSVSSLTPLAPPATHQITLAFRRPPGLTSPSPGRLPVSPHASSTDPNSAGHSPAIGAHPASHSPAAHPSAMQGSVAAVGVPPVAASNGKPVSALSVPAPPPVNGYGVADYSRKVNNMFDIVEVSEDDVVSLCKINCFVHTNW